MKLGSIFACTAAIAVGATAAFAQQSKEVTIVSWGGNTQDAMREALFKPAEKVLGITLKEDTTQSGLPDVRMQVQANSVTWDVVELPCSMAAQGEREDLFEALDYSKMPYATTVPKNLQGKSFVAGPVAFSIVMAWNTEKFKDNPPQNWADFFDLEKFPGKRGLDAKPSTVIEAALMGDGVAPDQLYPLDVDRALKKLETIKKETIFWESGSQAVQLLKDKQVDLTLIWGARAQAAISDGAQAAFTYNQAMMAYECFVIPKGSKNKEAAMLVINEMMSPVPQAELAKMIKYGPVNPAAYEHLPAEIAAQLNTAPENAKHQINMNYDWWAPNRTEVEEVWEEFRAQ